jgi:hypothetical protein
VAAVAMNRPAALARWKRAIAENASFDADGAAPG